jgi:chain length determinant protein tyrosine kinase EpsG
MNARQSVVPALVGDDIDNGGDAAPAPIARHAPLGDILAAARNFDSDQVERVLGYQRTHGVRFGEAAVALGLVSAQAVAQALSHQFRYAVDTAGSAGLHADLVMARLPFSPQAEVVRGVRAQLKMKLAARPEGRRAVAVLSPQAGDGRSWLAANLAVAFSQFGLRTLLIDADLRQPRQHLLFKLTNASGLSNMIGGRAESLQIDAVPSLPSLFVLPVGAEPPNPLELLESAAFERLLQDVQTQFDHVIVDTPALQRGMDGPVVAAACGSALMVLRKGITPLAAAQDLAAMLADGAATLAGVVLNEHR